jgi:hypothetical protein
MAFCEGRCHQSFNFSTGAFILLLQVMALSEQAKIKKRFS